MERLRRISDAQPGIRRQRRGKGFSYTAPDGERLSAREKERVDSLAVPPAWQDVWISPLPNSHIQATGHDSKGRKQYIYHARWTKRRQDSKFQRLVPFGHALPALRRRVANDLHRPGLPRDKVAAAVVRLMERSMVRVGGERYALNNRSYGAATVEKKHLEQLTSKRLHLHFPGKGGKEVDVDVQDVGVARVVRRSRRLPGRRLFEFKEGDHVAKIHASHVNQYIRHATRDRFTSKDLRTWSASVLLLERLLASETPPDSRERKKRLTAAIKDVADRLQNTPAVCRRSYLHPKIMAAYLDGTLEAKTSRPPHAPGLRISERRLLGLLEN